VEEDGLLGLLCWLPFLLRECPSATGTLSKKNKDLEEINLLDQASKQ
jgi:hypothetical protein